MKDPLKYQEALGQAVMKRREKMGLTREKVARLIGVSLEYIICVEEGREELDLSKMMCLAIVLDLPLSTLLALAECVLMDMDSDNSQS